MNQIGESSSTQLASKKVRGLLALESPRVRFAPAPSGYLHVGSARSALFNWLFAKRFNGTFILRIEDTNADLAKPEFYEAITTPLEWLGLRWDEGPYYQSQRTEKYIEAVTNLVDSKLAYCCECTREAIDERNKETGFRGGYDGYCRDHEVQDGPGITIRFKTPKTGIVEIDDLIRGKVQFQNSELEDFVIRRGNGTPVFLVANAVDDADMRITHVIRGEDLLNTTPKVILLWEALGFGAPPKYAHLPLLVGDDRKKLSKRRHSVALSDFQSQGILPEAMTNYLALLGWGPPDEKEIRPIDEIVDLFDLGSVNKSPAFFDEKKLRHINGEYLRALPSEDFAALANNHFEKIGWQPENLNLKALINLAPDLQERTEILTDLKPLVDWIFEEKIPEEKNGKEIKKIDKAMRSEKVVEVLDLVIEQLQTCSWDEKSIGEVISGVGESLSARSQVPVRIAVTGRRVGLPLYKPMAIVDRSLIIKRLTDTRSKLT